MKIQRKWLLHALALTVLVAVFMLYLRPEFMFALALQVWSCF